jgi:uncharacterized protein (DUF1697 family)
MGCYAAFLRGVNLGAKRRTGSAELRAAFEDLGMEEVATFRNSGNVVFSAEKASEPKLAGRIEACLGEAFGFEVPVVLRSEREVKAIAAYAPFEPAVVATTEGRLQVLLMSEKPAAGLRKRVQAVATDDDRLVIKGRELYWLPKGRMSEAELDLSTVERQLGLTTMRTMGTIEQIAAKYFAD